MEAEPDKRPATAKVVLDELTGIRGLLPTGMDPLQGYVATALTGLKEDEREAIVFVSSKIAEVAKRYELYVYQPRKATDPLLHADVAPEEVYRLDRNRVVRADLLFILANRPSIGVGQELEIAATHGKPVVLITREGTTISRMAKGSYANILAAFDYSTPEDLEKKLRQCVASNIDNLRRWRRKASSHAVNVGARLAATREAHEYTQQEVADHLGISYSLLRAIENGQHDNVGMRVIELLCNFYGASISELATSQPPRAQHLPPDANVRRLEGIARSLNWPASDFLDLRDDYMKELAASGSAASISEEEWTDRHGALEKRKFRDMEARGRDRLSQGNLFSKS